MRLVRSFVVAGGLALVGYLLRRYTPESTVGVWWPWFYVAAGTVLLALVLDHSRGWSARMFAWITGPGGLALGLWFTTGVPDQTPGKWLAGWMLGVGSLVLLLLAVARWHRRAGAGLLRWRSRRRERKGFASRWQIIRTASALAMRRRAKVLRPSLAGSWWRRWFATPAREFATCLARMGLLHVWSPVEDVTLRVGGPRTGKTGELAGRILDAPGAVIATSTRTDLVELCGSIRAERGPVRVFNPSGLGGIANTVYFDPLAGCDDPKTAVHRAEDLLSGVAAPGKGGGDMEFWTAQGRRVLAALLHAAALDGRSMRDVLAWVTKPGPSDTPGEDTASEQVPRALRRSPESAFELDAMQFLSTNSRTQSSICATIMPALGWLTDGNAVAAAAVDDPDNGRLDVAELLDTTGTVFLLGAEDGQTAPLVAALTGHVAREARRLAAECPGGRLDPPLTLALDEAALICPVPLDRWSSDMGGRGVTIHVAVQGRSQLRDRWGDQGAATIVNNAGTLLVYGSTKDHDDLQAYSALTGERWEEVPTFGDDGHHAPQRVPALSPAQIAQLKTGRVLIIRRGMPAAVGRVRMAWKRHDVKAHRRRLRQADRVGRRNQARQAWAGRWATARKTTAAAGSRAKHTAAARIYQYRSGRLARRYYKSRGRAPASIERIHHNQVGDGQHTGGTHNGSNRSPYGGQQQ